MTLKHRFAWLSTLLLAAATTGCGFPYRPVWLPDSSGFVYLAEETDAAARRPEQVPQRETRFAFYDLKARASRLLPPVPAQLTITPGISPNGKRAAFVRASAESERRTAQLIIVDLPTGAHRESKVFPFGDCPAGVTHEALLTAAEWSANNDRILVVVADPDGDAASQPGMLVGVFDTRDETLKWIPGIELGPVGYWGSSIAPDGSGFLASRRRPKPPREQGPTDGLVFVDWEGQIHNMTVPPQTRAALGDQTSEGFWAAENVFSFRVSSDGAALRLQRADYPSAVSFDCLRKVVGLRPNNTWSAAEIERMRKGGIVDCARLGQGEIIVEVRALGSKRDEYMIEFWNRQDGKRTTLVEAAVMPSIHPAPDGKTVAILYDKARHGRILVVDESGSRVADFAVGLSPRGMLAASATNDNIEPAMPAEPAKTPRVK